MSADALAGGINALALIYRQMARTDVVVGNMRPPAP